MKIIRGVVFDAVGTLIVPVPPAPEVYATVSRRYGSRQDMETIRVRFKAAFAKEEQKDRELNFRTSEAREEERWRSIVGQVLDDLSNPEACFGELFDHFSRPNAWRCCEETAAVLASLAGQGYELGLASNYDRRLHSVAAGLMELHPIRHLIISSEVGWRKPAPGFFQALCRTMQLAPEQLLLVGDDPDNDYAGAQAAGLEAVLYDPTGRAPASFRSITDLGQVAQWLRDHCSD
jgi:putative hydrolase of the HAD superfamily